MLSCDDVIRYYDMMRYDIWCDIMWHDMIFWYRDFDIDSEETIAIQLRKHQNWQKTMNSKTKVKILLMKLDPPKTKWNWKKNNVEHGIEHKRTFYIDETGHPKRKQKNVDYEI